MSTLLYVPGNVTIDEQLVGFRGRCAFRTYMPSKPDKYGLKIWVMADVDTAYCYNAEPYLGKQGNQPETGLAQVVETLSRPLYNSHRNVTFDNFLRPCLWHLLCLGTALQRLAPSGLTSHKFL